MFSLESPHRYQYTIFNIKRKIDLNYLKSAAMAFFPGLKHEFETAMVNSHGKRAINVRAIEVVLHFKNLNISVSYETKG